MPNIKCYLRIVPSLVEFSVNIQNLVKLRKKVKK